MSRSQPIKLPDAKVKELKQLASPAEQAEEAEKAERREYMKLAQRASRERKAIRTISEFAQTEEQWHSEMRKTLPKEVRDQYEQQDAEVNSFMHWMAWGWEYADPNAPDFDPDLFISFEDGVKDLDAFIEKRGTIHDGHDYDSYELRRVRPVHAIWEDGSYSRLTKGLPRQWRKPYWRCPIRLEALTTEEGEPTRIHALYGYDVALSAYHVERWKTRVRVHPNHYDQVDFDRCWLCQYERFQQQKRTETDQLVAGTERQESI